MKKPGGRGKTAKTGGITLAELVCYRYAKYPLYEMLRFIGKAKFTEYLLKFAGTAHTIPNHHRLHEAYMDLVLAKIYFNSKGWSDMTSADRELLAKTAKKLKVSINSAKFRGQRTSKQIPKVCMWLKALESVYSKKSVQSFGKVTIDG